MGHRDSSAQLGGHGGILDARTGIAEAAAPREAGGVVSGPRSLPAALLLAFVRFYIVFLSPFFGGTCKFYPSCSNYAQEAIARHGARRGLTLATKRLLRCHPFTRGGVDLVPDTSHGDLQ
ncbi:MAG TPA: membrane protein insertion efficiency factor YidD [Candidatus Acidoferrales bacterium]|nr:membrane protein insertion efficiency factor YidD [Candidatus Acidoferrales bacterium]